METHMEIKTGSETSEFKVTQTVVLVGTVVTSVGAILEVLAQYGIGAKWS
jgi:hypothetical protein